MESRHLLLAFILMNHTLTTTMWWVGGTWMGLSRKAAKHWMVASLANGVALILTVMNEGWPDTFMALLAGVLVVHASVSLRRGLQAFLKLRHTDGSHLMMAVGTTVFSLAICVPLGWRGPGILVCGLAICWLLGRTAQECFEPLKIEFKVGTAWAHTVTLGGGVALFAATAMTAMAPTWPWPWLLVGAQQALFSMVFISLTLSILTSFVLGYIVVMRLVRRLEHLSHHDGLTGLLNRRAIEYLLDREAQRLQRFSEPFSVLMVDIDHFKRINDRLGHPAGDAVLSAVAQALQAQAREVDRVARYGGEEFCVLLPHTLHEGALQAAERLREAISQINIPWNDETITVTISMGLASAIDPVESLQSLLRRADDALYRAKADGRNRVVSAILHAA